MALKQLEWGQGADMKLVAKNQLQVPIDLSSSHSIFLKASGDR